MGWASYLEAIREKHAELKDLSSSILADPRRSGNSPGLKAAELREDRIKGFLKEACTLMTQMGRLHSLIEEEARELLTQKGKLDSLIEQAKSPEADLVRENDGLRRQNNELREQNDPLHNQLALAGKTIDRFKVRIRTLQAQRDNERRLRKERERELRKIFSLHLKRGTSGRATKRFG